MPGRPTSLRVRPFPSSIVVSWTPPEEQHIMVRGYILGYGKGIADVYKQVLDAKQRYHTIKGLGECLHYFDAITFLVGNQISCVAFFFFCVCVWTN